CPDGIHRLPEPRGQVSTGVLDVAGAQQDRATLCPPTPVRLNHCAVSCARLVVREVGARGTMDVGRPAVPLAQGPTLVLGGEPLQRLLPVEAAWVDRLTGVPDE